MTRHIRSGLCSVTLRQVPWREVLEIALKAGVHAIDWNEAHLAPGSLLKAREIQRASRDHGITVPYYGSYLHVDSFPDMDRLNLILETASSLGTGAVRVWLARYGISRKQYSAAQIASIAKSLASLAARYKAEDLDIFLEFHYESLTEDADLVRSIIDESGQHNIYSLWQPRPGISLTDATREIDTLGEYLAHLHVYAWSADRERLALRSAGGFWGSLLGHASRLPGKDAFALLEFVRDDDVVAVFEDAKFLNETLKRLQGGDLGNA